jgi:hypothetical protein
LIFIDIALLRGFLGPGGSLPFVAFALEKDKCEYT